jgi:hypothetical protein
MTKSTNLYELEEAVEEAVAFQPAIPSTPADPIHTLCLMRALAERNSTLCSRRLPRYSHSQFDLLNGPSHS